MLWCYGMQNDVVDGRLRLNAKRLQMVMHRGSKGFAKLLSSMIQSGFLTPGKDDSGEFLYMNGWERNASYFQEKLNDRERKKRERASKMSGGIPSDVRPEIRQTSGGDPTPTLDPPQEVRASALPSTSSPPQEGKQRIRDPLTVRAFIEKFNKLVRNLGSGSPALQNGLDPYRASSIVERCRETGIKLEDITAAVLVDWFKPDTNRSTYTLEAFDKAAPKLIEKVTRDWQLARAEAST